MATTKQDAQHSSLSAGVFLRNLLSQIAAIRPFGIRHTESIMQFARLGTLTCLCNSRHSTEMDADRREVCRGCGGLPVACSGELLDRHASQAEIRAYTESLRRAGIRARGIDIPKSVKNLQELHDFLDQYRGKRGRKPPRRPNAPVALMRTAN